MKRTLFPFASFSFSTKKAELYRWLFDNHFLISSSFPTVRVFFDPTIFNRTNLPESPRCTGTKSVMFPKSIPDLSRTSDESSSAPYRTVHRKKSAVSWSNEGRIVFNSDASVVLHHASGDDPINCLASCSDAIIGS